MQGYLDLSSVYDDMLTSYEPDSVVNSPGTYQHSYVYTVHHVVAAVQMSMYSTDIIPVSHSLDNSQMSARVNNYYT